MSMTQLATGKRSQIINSLRMSNYHAEKQKSANVKNINYGKSNYANKISFKNTIAMYYFCKW